MHEQHHEPTQHQEHTVGSPGEHERPPVPRPQIYVASLADYTAGRLHGRWLDAARDPAVIRADIADLLAESPEPSAEEFAIHDFDDFGAWRVEEYDSIELVSHIATGIQEHGLAFAAWADVHEADPESFDKFTDAYLGHYDSLDAYAEELAEQLGLHAELEKLPESLQPYVRLDTAAMARDFGAGGEVYVYPDPNGGVWLFDGHV